MSVEKLIFENKVETCMVYTKKTQKQKKTTRKHSIIQNNFFFLKLVVIYVIAQIAMCDTKKNKTKDKIKQTQKNHKPPLLSL